VIRFLLLLIVAAAIGGFFTRPNADAHQKTVSTLFANGNADARGVAIEARSMMVEDFYVATHSVTRTGDVDLIECWGAFTRFFCTQPPAPPAKLDRPL
jgi:hypothetical protein